MDQRTEGVGDSPKESAWITRAGLVSNRQWTKKLMILFLGNPDKVVPNPFYKKAADMQLWYLRRILEIEDSPEFRAEFLKAQGRKKVAQEVVQRKQDTIMKYAVTTPIHLEIRSRETLEKNAARAYNDWHSYRDDFYAVDERKVSHDFLSRITVNYIRHEMSSYEDKLFEIHGKVGVGLAYEVIKKRILNKISETYPWLADECARQLATFL